MPGTGPQPARRLSPVPSLVIGFAAALIVVVIAGLLTLRAASDFASSSRLVVHAQLVLETLASLEVGYAKAVAAVRAYVITGEERYSIEVQDASVETRAAMNSLLLMTADNAEQQRDLGTLRVELLRREATLRRALTIRTQAGMPAVLELLRDPDVDANIQRVSDLLDQIRRRERGLLARRSQLDDERIVDLRWTLFAYFGCTLVILSLLFLRARESYRRRETARRDLEWQRAFADAIIDNAPMGLYMKSARDLTLVRVNKVVEDLMGASRDALLGKDDRSFYPPEIAEQHIASEHALLQRRDRLTEQEIVLQTPKGRRILHIKKVPLFSEDGGPDFLMGLFEDITERRDAEEQLKQRTVELEAANKELESFSYSVSHDLRAPLRAMDGYAAMLQEDFSARLDDEGRRFLVAIREGANRMGTLVQDLLAFSRLGRQPIEPHETATRDLVDTAWESLRQSEGSLRATLVVGDLPPSFGDPRLLLQIWTNLLDNAVKYSDKSPEPRIEVRGELVGNETVFSVRDNGVGFDMRYYDKLFNVFQRLHSEAEYAGTGVGLAIVQRIASRHGGRAWAQAVPGEGAQFLFSLPNRAANAAVPRAD